MNRREFSIASLATVTLGGFQSVSAQLAAGSDDYVSEFTGATFTWDASKWFLNGSGVTDKGWERFNLMHALGSLYVQIIPNTLVAPDEFANRFISDLEPEDIVSSDSFSDGGFAIAYLPPMSAPNGQIVYCEYQLGAFPGYDLQIRFWSREDHFADTYPLVQDIDLAGGPPFLFVAESAVDALDIASFSKAQGTSTRTSRSSTSASEEDSVSQSDSDVPVGDYASVVNERREAFLASWDVFYGHLMSLENLSGDEQTRILTIMVNIALEWQPYPRMAAELTAPEEMKTLSTLYVDWAGFVGEMGILFEQIYIGDDQSEAFVAARSSWEAVDLLLQAELGKHVTTPSFFGVGSMPTLSSRVKRLAQALA